MGLAGFVVGVLPEQDNLHFVEGTEIERPEYVLSGRIDGVLLILVSDKLRELRKIGLFELRSQGGFPGFFYLYVHNRKSTHSFFNMRRSTRLSLFFFVIGFCTCLLLIALVRFFSSVEWGSGTLSSYTEVVFHKLGECPDCKAISREHWKVGSLKDNNDLHLESGRRLGIQAFVSNTEFEKQVASFVRRGKLKELDEKADGYRLKNLTHSYPYLIPKAVDLLEEIAERFKERLAESGLPPYYLMVSSVLRTMESQQGLGKQNYNATRNTSSHVYGTSFDISYKEFLPLHEQRAAEGYCRHDMMRHPLGEILTELSKEGKCRVVREVKQACFHITVSD